MQYITRPHIILLSKKSHLFTITFRSLYACHNIQKKNKDTNNAQSETQQPHTFPNKQSHPGVHLQALEQTFCKQTKIKKECLAFHFFQHSSVSLQTWDAWFSRVTTHVRPGQYNHQQREKCCRVVVSNQIIPGFIQRLSCPQSTDLSCLGTCPPFGKGPFARRTCLRTDCWGRYREAEVVAVLLLTRGMYGLRKYFGIPKCVWGRFFGYMRCLEKYEFNSVVWYEQGLI